jgi:selenocysteine lyase/cysteine desulfurase
MTAAANSSSVSDPPALLGRDAFTGLDHRAYLYTGAHAPALRRVTEAIARAHEAQSLGPGGRDVLFGAEVEARAKLAAMVGRATADVGLLGDASTAWNAIARGLAWEPGDNVVLNEYEHPSVVLPFLRLKEDGLEVRVVRRGPDWDIPADAIAAACDVRTRAIAVSHVGYVTGLRHDLAELAAIADRHGIPLLVDASHALGVVPVEAEHAAIVVSASYKWLLGPYGVGIVIWNRDRLPGFRPGLVGWRSTTEIFTDDRFERVNVSDDARRFQLGAPSLSGIAGLSAALSELEALDPAAVERHALALSARAIAALEDAGLEVTTPRDPARRAGNVAFLHSDGERVAARMAELGVPVWGGDGRIRASFHVLNDGDAPAALVDALREVTGA